MQASNVPGKIQKPFADDGDKQTIPVASQIGVTDGRASYTDGFPPLTRTPIVAGGVPPFGTDMNGILNAITAVLRWQNAGGQFNYDGAFAAAVGGYPKGALLQKSDGSGFWLSTSDNNSNNPDTGGANWADPGAGRLLRRSVYYLVGGVQTVSYDGASGTTTGATVFTSLPQTSKIRVRISGAGGGGGGAGFTSSTTVSLGGGGGAGAYADLFLTTGFSGGVPVTIGGGGNGGSITPSNGSSGGTTSFGSISSCAGGSGGVGAGQLSTSFTAAGGGGGNVYGTNSFVGGQGAPGVFGVSFGPSTYNSGNGGNSGFGYGGGFSVTSTTKAGNAGQFGSGGSGGVSNNTPAAGGVGGRGGDGLIIVEEYA
ncbi:hypothetical protein SAMN05216189_103743 [Pseudomonas delhiensis]|uniref:Uncharacterized protein n=1 Tax=Pseudomonas delhiensis TaxID=366289 RepID=A0A239MZU6_9PSED|nr:hypothetical protein [Pseudomonas delhiensis]SDK41066.1 hypothetical protein SAMN05216189_103743 [Pseudomonas delhiensis]SNT47753.1 hypothetical protein SAMN06295949_13339 [Pseudomonas delhiensis]